MGARESGCLGLGFYCLLFRTWIQIINVQGFNFNRTKKSGKINDFNATFISATNLLNFKKRIISKN